MRYAVSDIHGKYELFLKLLHEIKFSNIDTLYVLGDVVDGMGSNATKPKDIEILQYIMKMPNVQMIMGNHEAELLEYLNDNFIPSKQKYTFTDKVEDYLQEQCKEKREEKYLIVKKYLYMDFFRYIVLPTNKLIEIHKFLRKLPYYIVLEGYILCHGGIEIPYDNIPVDKVLKYQQKNKVIWLGEEFYNNKNRVQNTKIIFGHTGVNAIEPTCTGIWKNEQGDKIGIDTSSFNEPTIACLNLDTMDEIIV